MRALVLSGGGLKGSYQIGAYKALKKLKYDFDIVTGTSIGAINGAFITAKEYKKAIELWKNVKIDFLFTEKVNEDLIVLEYLRNIIENIWEIQGAAVVDQGYHCSAFSIHRKLRPMN